MNFLDMRTVLFSYSVTNIVCTLIIAFLWHQNRKRFAGAPWWTMNFALQAAASILIIARGSISDWLSTVLANIFIIAGMLCCYLGLERFVGGVSSHIRHYALLAAFAGVHAYFTVVQPNLAVRKLNLSLGLLLVCGQCVWLMIRCVEPDMHPLTRGVGLVFAGFCLVNLARITLVFAEPWTENDFFHSGTLDMFILLAYQIMLILLTYHLTLMVNNYLIMGIRTQEAKFTVMFHSSPSAIILIRLADGKIFEVNDSFVKLSGYQAGEAIGNTTLELRFWVNKDDRQRIFNALSQQQSIQGEEYQFRKKSGEFLTGLLSADLLTINNQPWVLASISDISDRKRAEAQLQRNEQILRLFIEHTPAAVAMFDREMRYIVASRRYLRDYDLDEQQLVGRSHYDVFPEIPERWKNIHQRCLAGAVEICEEDPFPRLNGQLDWVRWEMHPWCEQNDQIGGVILFSEVITARKHAENQLKRQAAILNALLNSPQETMAMLDTEGRVLSINLNGAKRFGMLPEEMLGRIIYDLLPEPVASERKKIISGVMHTGDPAHFEDQRNSMHFINSIYSVTDPQSGELLGTTIFAVDITERKRMEAELRKSENRFRSTLDNMLEGGQIIGFDWRYRYVNHIAAAQAKQTKEALLGHTMMEMFPGIEQTPLFVELSRCMNKRVAGVLENEFVFPDNSKGWFELSVQPVPEGLFILSMDISERKRGEHILQNLNTAIKIIPLGLFISDLDGKITYTNFAAAEMHGYQEQELLGQTISTLIPPDLRKPVSLEDLSSWKGLTRASLHLRKDGSTFPAQLISEIVKDARGEPCAIVTGCEDITERKQAEQRQRLTTHILTLLNSSGAQVDIISKILLSIQTFLGIEAAGIRLQTGDDFPYYATTGFSPDFIAAENSLLARDQHGDILLDSQQKPVIECMCGRVIAGNIDSNLPFFTEGGSFWLNGISDFFAAVPSPEFLECTRKSCVQAGYESVALIPLRSNGDIIGLLQANDPRKGMFTPEVIQFLEHIGASIGIAMTRKRVEEQLLHLQKAVETMHLGVTITDPDRKILYTNPADAAMHGYTVEELIGQYAQIFAPPHLRQSLTYEHIETAQHWARESVNIHKDGSAFPVQLISDVVRSAQGQAIAIVTTCEDITQRKQAEEALRISEEKHRTLFETMTQGVVYQDTSGAIIGANPAAENILGLTLDQMQGRTSMDPRWKAIHEDGSDFPGCTHPAIVALQTGQHVKDVVMGVFHPGEEQYHWININAIPQFKPGKTTPYQVYTTFADITARKSAEDRLRQRLEIERTLANISGWFIQTADFDEAASKSLAALGRALEASRSYLFLFREYGTLMDNTHEWCAEGVNPQQEQLQNLPTSIFPWWMAELAAGRVIHIPDVALMPPEAQAEKDTLEQQDIQSLVVLPIYTDTDLAGFIGLDNVFSRNVWGEEEINVLQVAAQIIGNALQRKQTLEQLQYAYDIMEKRVEERTAELVLLNDELVRASKLKDEFLANMSHELRTPLNAVLGYAQILQGADNLTERQQEGLKTIKKSGEHLLTLINDILDLAKIEAGRLEIHHHDVYLPDFLRQIAAMMRIKAEQKGLSFVYDAESDLPAGVVVDEKRLREVLFNLLGNAIKFTEKGSVTFKVTKMPEAPEVSAASGISEIPASIHPGRAAQHRLQFSVIDTGIGISSQQLDEIFEPFHQVGEERYSIEGTGLGLAISRKLVELMGSELKVESILGEGSRFWFELALPVLSDFKRQKVVSPPRITGYTGKRQTILVVDDRAENRNLLVDMLFPLDFRILEAENGKMCLEQVERQQPDVILLDLYMPVLNGFETAQYLKQHKAYQSIVIIAVSAGAFQDVREKSLEAGCDDFIVKPFQLHDLLERLQQHLGLEWIYEETTTQLQTPPAPSAQAVNASKMSLPPEIHRQLRLQAERGDVKKILEQLQVLEASGSQFLPIVLKLRRLAKNFDVDQIAEMLESMEME